MPLTPEGDAWRLKDGRIVVLQNLPDDVLEIITDLEEQTLLLTIQIATERRRINRLVRVVWHN